MKEHHLRVTRTARYYVRGEIGPRLSQLWFVCHGYGQLAVPFVEGLSVLADETRLLVAPEALSRFYLGGAHPSVGASWMTREDRLNEIGDYLDYLNTVDRQIRDLLGDRALSVFVLGFSQGAATAARWVCRGTVRADCLVLWGESVPPELDQDPDALSKLASLRLVLVAGSRDRFLDARRRREQRARLQEKGVRFEEIRFNGGHRLDDEVLLRIASASQHSEKGKGR